MYIYIFIINSCWQHTVPCLSFSHHPSHVVHPYSSMDAATAWKKFHFISSNRSDFHGIYNLSILFYAFFRCMLTSLSGDEMLRPKNVNWSTNFRGLPRWEELSLFCFKHISSVLFAFMLRPIPPASCSRLCNKDSAWGGAFVRSARSSMWSASVIVSTGYWLLLAFFLMRNHFLLFDL